MNRIKEVIKEKKTNNKFVAEAIGVSTTDMSNYIAERRHPKHKRLIAMAKTLNTSIKELYPNSKRIVTYDLGLGRSHE